jgi:NAD(P)-dependent dehydrogenase (short-subunit alcohol dehydrogenase family)
MNDNGRSRIVQQLKGRVALVTGGGSGLGAAICRTLAAADAIVVAGDVRPAAAEKTASELRASGARAESVALDVANPRSAAEVVRGVVERYGTIDVLVNNAGVDRTVPLDELKQEEWDRISAVNLGGPFTMAREVFPLMREKKSGAIVNIVSTAAKRAWPNASAYHATKWGLLGLSHAMHVEGRPAGIKVTAVIAGGMRTPFLLDRVPDLDPGLLQDPANVAAAVRFVLEQPAECVIPEITVIPMRETSWP